MGSLSAASGVWTISLFSSPISSANVSISWKKTEGEAVSEEEGKELQTKAFALLKRSITKRRNGRRVGEGAVSHFSCVWSTFPTDRKHGDKAREKNRDAHTDFLILSDPPGNTDSNLNKPGQDCDVPCAQIRTVTTNSTSVMCLILAPNVDDTT